MLKQLLGSMRPILMPIDRTWDQSSEYRQVIGFISQWWRLMFIASFFGLALGLSLPVFKPKYTSEISYGYSITDSSKTAHDPSQSLRAAFSDPYFVDIFAGSVSDYWAGQSALPQSEVPFALTQSPATNLNIRESLTNYIKNTMVPAIEQGVNVHNIPLLVYSGSQGSYRVRTISSNPQLAEKWAPAFAQGLSNLIRENNLMIEKLDNKNIPLESLFKDISGQLREERLILEGLIEQYTSNIASLQKRLGVESVKCQKLLGNDSSCTFNASMRPTINSKDTHIQDMLSHVNRLKMQLAERGEQDASIRPQLDTMLAELTAISKELMILSYTNVSNIYGGLYESKVTNIVQNAARKSSATRPMPLIIPAKDGRYSINTTNPFLLRLGIWGIFGLFSGLVLAAAWAIFYQRFKREPV